MNLINKHLKGYCTLLIAILLYSSCEEESDTVIFTDVELEILQLVNQYRIINGLEMLEMNNLIYEKATNHTQYMISKNTVSHDNSDMRFREISESTGAMAFAENVAMGQKSAQQVVDKWLKSDGHRENIEGDYNYTGISAIRNERGQYFYTQIFANIPK